MIEEEAILFLIANKKMPLSLYDKSIFLTSLIFGGEPINFN
ncbi:hypothetical protein [Listeria monocytogenes]|nr:hypothetical protein [Listeria monocytogenes]